VLAAMDPRIDRDLAENLQLIVAEEHGVFVAPSLKHISRNPERLFLVVEVPLTNGAIVRTANLQLGLGKVVWRGGDAAGYNEFELDWLPDGAYRNVGRNDPCPCGSGKKFKRCHGA
jgi:SEC-C motif